MVIATFRVIDGKLRYAKKGGRADVTIKASRAPLGDPSLIALAAKYRVDQREIDAAFAIKTDEFAAKSDAAARAAEAPATPADAAKAEEPPVDEPADDVPVAADEEAPKKKKGGRKHKAKE